MINRAIRRRASGNANLPSWVFDIPFTSVTLLKATEEMERLILLGKPTYIITANVNYAMLVSQYTDLHQVNQRAALIVPDGSPVVWASWLTSRPLPERVTGTDLLYQFSGIAARKGYSVFLLGAAPGVADQAARNLCSLYPGLRIAGTEAPVFEELTPEEQGRLIARINATRPDVLFLAMGQPQGERWIFRNLAALRVPVSIQVGSAVDFAAGRVPRAPVWMQSLGLECPYRIYQEPVRLAPRYLRNAIFLARSMLRFAMRAEFRRQDRPFNQASD
jgi:N-acetylglucosaminyldiphosphoundecaprenol N-acetyl-beta-D-mannosaminyltransferase